MRPADRVRSIVPRIARVARARKRRAQARELGHHPELVRDVTPPAPYRKNLVGLPLQRSLFGAIDRCAERVFASDLLPEGRFGARLDEHGDLYLDKSHVEALRRGLPSRLSDDAIHAMGVVHRKTCDALLAATDEGASRAAACAEGEARALASKLGEAIAAILAYGVLAKFVPDVLLAALANEGDTRAPPFPVPSPGARLGRATIELHLACVDAGHPPAELAASWPDVDRGARALVLAFCEAHAGFGPLAWDAPGHEEPAYVLRTLVSAFGGVDRATLLGRLERMRDVPPARDADASPLRNLLAFWLAFLELETWYVRRAFFRGLAPLLRRIAEARRALSASDLLFARIDEIAEGRDPDREVVDARRARYASDLGYLTKHGVDSDRIGRMMALG
jgi:hypothetical protein